MSTTAIQKFLECYTDEQLAALRAHCEDGKLSYRSCCCLIACRTAVHALRGSNEEERLRGNQMDYRHHTEARNMPMAIEAEREFEALGHDYAKGIEDSDDLRRVRTLPLILAEQQRRSGCAEVAEVVAEVVA